MSTTVTNLRTGLATIALAAAIGGGIMLLAPHDPDPEPAAVEARAEVTDEAPPPQAPRPPASEPVVYGTTLWRLPGMDHLAVSPDGKTLVAARRFTEAVVVDAATGAILRRIETNDPLAVSADLSVLATTAGYGDETRVALIDVATGRERQRIPAGCRVSTLSLAADGGLVAIGCEEGKVRVHDAATGAERHAASLEGEVEALLLTGSEVIAASEKKQTRAFTIGGAEVRDLPHGESEVTALAASPDGRIATADRGGIVRVFAPKGEPVVTIDTGSSFMIKALALSEDGAFVVTGGHDGKIRLLDVAAGKERATLLADARGQTSAALAADGTIWGGSYDGAIRSWTRDGEEIVREPRGHVAPVRQMAVSPDGARLYALGGASQVVVWDTGGAKERLRIGEGHAKVLALALSPDGARLATGSLDGRVRVFEAETGRLLHATYAHERGVTAVAWSPDGARLATGGRDGAIIVHPSDLGPIVFELWEEYPSVTALAWSRDAARLVAGSSMGVVRLVDAATGRPLASLREAYPETIDWAGYAADGRTFAVAGGDDLWLFDAETGAPRLDASGIGTSFTTVAWAKGGEELAVGDTDGHLWALDAKTGAVRAHIQRPDERFHAVALHPNGRQLFVSRDDTTIARWDVARDLVGKAADAADDPDDVGLEVTLHRDRRDRVMRPPHCPPAKDLHGDPLPACAAARFGSAQLRARDEITAVAVSPDGRLLATSGQGDEWIPVWSTTDGSLVRWLWQSEIGAGPMLFLGSERLAACDSMFSRLVLWDLTTGRKLGVTPMRCAALAPAPGGGLAVGGRDGTITLVSTDGVPGRRIALGEIGTVKAIAFGEAGELAAMTVEGVLARVPAKGEPTIMHVGAAAPLYLPGGRLVVADEQAVYTFGEAGLPGDDGYQDEDEEARAEHALPDPDQVEGFATTPFGQVIVRTETHVALIDAARPGKPTRRLKVGPHTLVAPGPNADTFVVGRDQAAELWSWSKGEATLRRDGHDGWVAQVAATKDQVLTNDGTVRVWDPEGGRLVATRDGARVALLLPDGRGAVTLEDDAVGVDLLPEGERFTIPSGGKEPQTPAALSPDGRTLVVTEPEGALGLYDLEKRRRIGELRLDEGDGYVTGLAVSQGGDRIAATKGSVVELRSPKGALLAELEIGEEAVDALAFASDGRLATAGQDGIRIWSKAGKPLASLEGHHTRTGAAAFSPDGRHLVTGDIFGELMIWDLAKKRREAHFVAHRNVVTSIAFAPGTSTFVTGSWDGTALRWDLRTLVR